MKKETKALSYIEIALECQDILAQKKDQHKELLYQSASCKEILEDYKGALKDYKRVLDNIGAFSSAVEGISRIERKIGKSSNMLPTSNGIGPTVSREEVDEQDIVTEYLKVRLLGHR